MKFLSKNITFLLGFLVITLSIKAQVNYFNLEKEYYVNGKAKNNAVISAKYASKAMHFAEKLYFGYKNPNILYYSDSIAYNTGKAIEHGEKAIEVSRDSSKTGRQFMENLLYSF